MSDLTVSSIERQSVLNNRYAVDALQKNLGFTGSSRNYGAYVKLSHGEC